MAKCITPTQRNMLHFLRFKTTPQTVDDIRFGIDSAHGCVWPSSRVYPALYALQHKRLISKHPEGWVITPEGRNSSQLLAGADAKQPRSLSQTLGGAFNANNGVVFS